MQSLCVSALDGPYGLFAGRDASRGLATFTINNEAVRDTCDDLSDLSAYEIDSMKEWAAQFSGQCRANESIRGVEQSFVLLL